MRNKKLIMAGIASVLLLIFSIVLSVACGVQKVGWNDIIGAFQTGETSEFFTNVVKARIPRTIFGIFAGAALGVSGALMQAVTRNPIADPSIIGVNTGAALFVVCGMSFLHSSTGNQYIWLAFAGAAITATLVYGLASLGYGGATPMKLALAGAAASTALQSMVNTVMLPNSQVMDQFRFWQTGSLGGATYEDIKLILPYLMVGFIVSILLAPALNTMALGDEAATGLGVNVALVRVVATAAAVLLCASITALAGPIGFVGLMMPHLVRLLLGPDIRKIIPFSAIGGASLLLVADVLGRMLGRPGEVETGIITALIGAPVFIIIIRKAKVHAL